MWLRYGRLRLATCFEPSLFVERRASGARVVPVAGELSRGFDNDLAVLVRRRHRPPRLHIDNLKPRQLSALTL